MFYYHIMKRQLKRYIQETLDISFATHHKHGADFYLLKLDALVELLYNAPKSVKEAKTNIDLSIAREVLRLRYEEDWMPMYVALITKENYPWLNITTTHKGGENLILLAEKLLTIKERQP